MAKNEDQHLFSTGFDQQTLTAGINRAPYRPGRIAELKLFEEKGISTLKAMVELDGDLVNLVPTSLRGGPAPIYNRERRKLVEIESSHLKTRSTILADSVQDQRQFGSTMPETVLSVRDKHLEGMRADLETTLERHRVTALQGQVLDVDGDVLLDLFSAFDVAQQTQSLALSTSTTNVRNLIVAAKRKSEEALGADKPTGWVGFCSPSFFDALVAHPALEAMVAGWSAADMLRDDVRASINIGGVRFEEYRSPFGLEQWIPDGEATLVPTGVNGLLLSRFAPADYVDTVNTEGLPIYARAHELPFGRGLSIEAQSNVINLCSRPRAIIKLTAD